MRRGGENLRQSGVIKKVDSNLFLIIDDLGEERKKRERREKEAFPYAYFVYICVRE